MEGADILPTSKKAGGKQQKRQQQRYIREDDEDTPLDLLAPNALVNISTRKSILRTTKPNNKSKAKVNEDGKLILNDDSDDDMSLDNQNQYHRSSNDTTADGVDAYMSAVSGPDAIRRGQKGRLKVTSSHKRQAIDDGDEEMDIEGIRCRESSWGES